MSVWQAFFINRLAVTYHCISSLYCFIVRVLVLYMREAELSPDPQVSSSGMQCCIVVMSVIDNHASCITTMRCPDSNHNVVRASSRKFGYHKYLSFFPGLYRQTS